MIKSMRSQGVILKGLMHEKHRKKRLKKMDINHIPLFDTAKIEAHYSEKDGVPVKYVCTSATNEHAANAADIFYRAEPHPEFGNRYFGLYIDQQDRVMITNADAIEDAEFAMIEDNNGDLHYSAHRHDYKTVDGKMVDGGRAYVRSSGTTISYRAVDGELVEAER